VIRFDSASVLHLKGIELFACIFLFLVVIQEHQPIGIFTISLVGRFFACVTRLLGLSFFFCNYSS